MVTFILRMYLLIGGQKQIHIVYILFINTHRVVMTMFVKAYLA